MEPTSEPTRLEWTVRRPADGLRTRYRPGCRINHAFFTVVPWLNVLLLGTCVVFTLTSRTLVPGVAIDLPVAPFREGLNSDLVLVVNPLPAVPPAVAEPDPKAAKAATAADPSTLLGVMVFFNDDRFNLSLDNQLGRLEEAVAGYLERVGPRDALLYVDRNVPHGDVMSLVTLLRRTGVRHANIAVKTP